MRVCICVCIRILLYKTVHTCGGRLDGRAKTDLSVYLFSFIWIRTISPVYDEVRLLNNETFILTTFHLQIFLHLHKYSSSRLIRRAPSVFSVGRNNVGMQLAMPMSISYIQLRPTRNVFPLMRFLILKTAESRVERDLANMRGVVITLTFGFRPETAQQIRHCLDARVVFSQFRPLSSCSFSECCQHL